MKELLEALKAMNEASERQGRLLDYAIEADQPDNVKIRVEAARYNGINVAINAAIMTINAATEGDGDDD